MCVDNRAINKFMIKYCFLLPKLDDMSDIMWSVVIVSKIYLKSDYHQMCICHGDEWKTNFKIKDKLYELVVMTFGLIHAHSTLWG